MRKKSEARPWGAGPCGKNMGNRGWFSMAFSHGAVKPAGLYFHLRPLAGLLSCGVWCDRLVLWLPLVDQAARLLRDAVGGRI